MRDRNSTINKITGAVIAVTVRIIIILLLVTVVTRGAKTAYEFGHAIFYDSSVDEAPGRDISVEIPASMGTSEVASLLKEKGVIGNRASFIVQARFFEYDIRPGSYVLNSSKTSREILEQLEAGPSPEE